MRYWIFAVALMITACESTRSNTVTTKTRTKNTAITKCYVADRCEVNP